MIYQNRFLAPSRGFAEGSEGLSNGQTPREASWGVFALN